MGLWSIRNIDIGALMTLPGLLSPVLQGGKVALRHPVLWTTLWFGQWLQGSTGVGWLLSMESGVRWCLVLSLGHNSSELLNYCDFITYVACNGGLDAILDFGLSIPINAASLPSLICTPTTTSICETQLIQPVTKNTASRAKFGIFWPAYNNDLFLEGTISQSVSVSSV